MPNDLIVYITRYGYLAIFLLVFLQEIGIPNPIPNELVLLFSGYMIFLGLLKLPLVVLAAVLADFTGTCVLHTVFYFSGAYILQHKPRWLPFPTKTIHKLKQRISKYGLGGIYIGRLTPFIRGYTSVIAGLLQIETRIFLPVALITASIWVVMYVTAGILLGPFWNQVVANINDIKYIMLMVFSTILLIIVIRSIMKYRTIKDE